MHYFLPDLDVEQEIDLSRGHVSSTEQMPPSTLYRCFTRLTGN